MVPRGSTAFLAELAVGFLQLVGQLDQRGPQGPAAQPVGRPEGRDRALPPAPARDGPDRGRAPDPRRHEAPPARRPGKGAGVARCSSSSSSSSPSRSSSYSRAPARPPPGHGARSRSRSRRPDRSPRRSPRPGRPGRGRDERQGERAGPPPQQMPQGGWLPGQVLAPPMYQGPWGFPPHQVWAPPPVPFPAKGVWKGAGGLDWARHGGYHHRGPPQGKGKGGRHRAHGEHARGGDHHRRRRDRVQLDEARRVEEEKKGGKAPPSPHARADRWDGRPNLVDSSPSPERAA